MAWGTLQLGGLTFRETTTASESNGQLTVKGQESTPPQSSAAVRAAYLNVLGMVGATVPLVASDKSELTGFYTVTSASVDDLNVQGGTLLSASWSAGLVRLGTERDIEFESRLTEIARSTDLTGPPSAVFWHAPPPGATSYYTGATVPSGTVTRQSADGAVTVYTGLPVGVFPRWTCPAAGYMAGSARVLLDGIRRAGLDTAAASAWEVSNGLVRVASGVGGLISVSCWSGTDWVSVEGYAFGVNGADFTDTAPELTIIRNDPEQVTVRLSYATSDPGRFAVDLSLRRGARFVAGVVKRHSAATLSVAHEGAATATATTGGLVADATDADGNRFVMGSSRTVATGSPAFFTKASATQLDFFLGHQVGAAPVAGDAFDDLLSQYLGSVGDDTRTVRR